MSQAPAIEARDVVKRFKRHILNSEYSTWKTALMRSLRGRKPTERVTVLDGVSFAVEPGRTLAVIGQNGSGKSTLLKILSGIYKADGGELAVRGRQASLIELGAGFHPEFSGRENVFINGAILGLSKKEIAARFDDIVAYAGLGEYIDAPVRTYSSGMYVRLGFSVAVNVDPDVLMVDEVLAVGDEAFAHKCEDKINEFRRAGKTICLVTHDLSAVMKFADEALWLDGGKVAAYGDPRQVIDAYRQRVARSEDAIRRQEARPAAKLDGKRWGSGEVVITGVRLTDGQGGERGVFHTGDPLTVEIDFERPAPTQDVVVGVAINNASQVLCYGTNTQVDQAGLSPWPDKGTVTFAAQRVDLLQGTYFLDVAAHAADGRAYDYHRGVLSFAVRSGVTDEGVFRPPHTWRLSPAEEASS